MVIYEMWAGKVIAEKTKDIMATQQAMQNTLLIDAVIGRYCSFHISLSKAFWRFFFYYLFRTETYIICVNVFYVVRNEISADPTNDK